MLRNYNKHWKIKEARQNRSEKIEKIIDSFKTNPSKLSKHQRKILHKYKKALENRQT